MPPRAPQFRLRSLTGLFLVSGFSLIVWLAVAFGVAQLQHDNACDSRAPASAQNACKAVNR